MCGMYQNDLNVLVKSNKRMNFLRSASMRNIEKNILQPILYSINTFESDVGSVAVYKYKGMISNRNEAAHGKAVPLSFADLLDYHSYAVIVLNKLSNILNVSL